MTIRRTLSAGRGQERHAPSTTLGETKQQRPRVMEGHQTGSWRVGLWCGCSLTAPELPRTLPRDRSIDSFRPRCGFFGQGALRVFVMFKGADYGRVPAARSVRVSARRRSAQQLRGPEAKRREERLSYLYAAVHITDTSLCYFCPPSAPWSVRPSL